MGYAFRTSVLSIITGDGKWVEAMIPMDPLYLTLLVAAEKKFWRCVQSGGPPHLINVDAARPQAKVIRIIDMSASKSWAEFADLFRHTHNAFLANERARTQLRALMRESAYEAIGNGVRAKRSRSGEIVLEILKTGDTSATCH